MGRGKGKRGGKGRGGGGRRMFITNAEELELNNRRQEALGRLRAERRIAAGAMSDDEEAGSELDFKGGEDDAGGFIFETGDQGESEEEESEEEDLKLKKASGVQGLIQVQNPNLDPKRRHDRGIKIKDLKKMSVDDADSGLKPTLTRREREEQQKQLAQEAYMKAHRAGKTDEAKKDMERLEIIKKRREEAAKKREAEAKEAEELREKMEGEVEAANEAASTKVAKLESRDIKKMNPTLLKENLKALGLSIQGSKKDLMARLIEAHKKM